MKKRHKYLNPIIIFMCVYIFGLWIYGLSCGIVKWIYAYLNHLFPNTFPEYSAVLNPNDYIRLERIFQVLGVFVALCLINLIALRIDNKKYERISILTEGQYFIKDGLRLYFKEFLLSDIITAVILPIVMLSITYFIPENAFGYFGLMLPSWLGYTMRPLFGFFPSVLTVAVFSYLGRLLAIPGCVKSWRAAWLTDI